MINSFRGERTVIRVCPPVPAPSPTSPVYSLTGWSQSIRTREEDIRINSPVDTGSDALERSSSSGLISPMHWMSTSFFVYDKK